MTLPLNIRTTKDSNDKYNFELIHNGVKIGEVSYVQIVEMIMQFTSSLRWRDGVK